MGSCRSIVLLCVCGVCVCVFYYYYYYYYYYINSQSSTNIYLPQKIFTRVYYDYLIYVLFIGNYH